jgi:hypothetical protein
MGHIKEPKGVYFFIKSEPLTQADRKLISEYIIKNSRKRNKAILTKKKAVGSKKSLEYS